MSSRRARLEHAASWATAALNHLQRGNERACHRDLREFGKAMNPQLETPEHFEREPARDDSST